MIATYIQELLATNNRVIVPNYGAFLVRATSKSKDANTLEEKLKDIYFSPFLKFNDELLEKYIIKKEGATKEQAAEKIAQFINDIKKELDADKNYEIKGFGHFEADKQGKVQFITVVKKEGTSKDTQSTDSKPARPVSGKTTTAKKAAEKEETKTVTKEKTPEKPKVEESKPVATKTEHASSKLEEFKKEEKETPKEEKTTEPTPEKPIYSYRRQKKPVNKGLIWSIAIGVPLAIIFVWALLNFSTIKKVLNKDKNKTEKVAQNKKTTKAKKEQTTKQETTQKQEVKTAQTQPQAKKQETKPAPPQKKYYIIAGSFKNERYADAFLNKLKAEGYNAEKLAERNGMHAVSYNSFTDKRKAIAEYKFLAQEKGLQTWILYY